MNQPEHPASEPMEAAFNMGELSSSRTSGPVENAQRPGRLLEQSTKYSWHVDLLLLAGLPRAKPSALGTRKTVDLGELALRFARIWRRLAEYHDAEAT